MIDSDHLSHIHGKGRRVSLPREMLEAVIEAEDVVEEYWNSKPCVPPGHPYEGLTTREIKEGLENGTLERGVRDKVIELPEIVAADEDERCLVRMVSTAESKKLNEYQKMAIRMYRFFKVIVSDEKAFDMLYGIADFFGMSDGLVRHMDDVDKEEFEFSKMLFKKHYDRHADVLTRILHPIVEGER